MEATELEELRALKIELTQQNNQIKQRLIGLEVENRKFKTKYTTVYKESFDHKSKLVEKQNEYTDIKKTSQQTIDDLEHKNALLEDKIDEIYELQKKEVYEMESDYKKKMDEVHKEKDDLQEKLEGFTEYRTNERDNLLLQRDELKKKCEDEKKLRLEQVNEKERDRIKETEQLRKEMLQSIKKTKANLLALNDEQLQTTTRLTILQNHQLTTELEHQSKQTELLIIKNNKMKQQIETYQRETEIHKEVEKELAKRSHFCQKVIKRLKEELKSATGGVPEGSQKPGMRDIPGRDDKGNEDLINFLEQKLEQHERNLIVKVQEYDALQHEYDDLEDMFNGQKQKYKRAALLLTEFLDDMLSSTPNILQPDKDLHLNLDKIKDTPIENLPKEDKVTLVLVLLKQLQPYFSAANLNVAPPESDRKTQKRGSVANPPRSGKVARPPQLNQEEIGINRILNNINVQTRKAGDAPTSLPPIGQR